MEVPRLTWALVCLSCLTCGCCGEIYLDFSVMPSSSVDLGEDFELHCIVHDYYTARLGLITNWWKRQGNESIKIAQNDFVDKNADDADRYNGTYREHGSDVTFVLKVSDAQARDNGEFGCSIEPYDSAEIFKHVNVYVPVKTVRFFAMRSDSTEEAPLREYGDGERVQFREGEDYYFRCVIEGSNPEPDVMITSGEQTITDQFTRDVMRTVTGPRPALRETTHTIVMTMKTPLKASWENSGQKITCAANVQYTQSVSVYITPQLSFAPRLECPAVLLVHLHQDNVELACKVRAHPSVEKVVWSWSQSDGTTVFLHQGDTDGHYTSTVQEDQDGNSDERIVSLKVDRIYSQMFRSYYVKITSSAGNADAEILLGKAPQDDNTDTSEANFLRLSSAHVTTLLVALASYVFL